MSFSSQTAYRPMRDNRLKVLRHINLHLSTKRPRKIGIPGHAGTGFWKFCIYKNSVFKFKTKNFSKNRQKIINKNFAGLRPAPPPYGAAPHPPTKANAKCLAAVVLDSPAGPCTSEGTGTAYYRLRGKLQQSSPQVAQAERNTENIVTSFVFGFRTFFFRAAHFF